MVSRGFFARLGLTSVLQCAILLVGRERKDAARMEKIENCLIRLLETAEERGYSGGFHDTENVHLKQYAESIERRYSEQREALLAAVEEYRNVE